MNKALVVLVLFLSQFANAQFFEDYFYYEGEIGGIAGFLIENEDSETTIASISGLSFRGGIGVHDPDEFLFLGINSGMDGNFRWKLGILPVYLNSKILVPVSDSGRILLWFGYGKSFEMGPGNRHGFLRKYTIGYGNITNSENLISFFIEANNYGFTQPDGFQGKTLSLGVNYTFL